MAYFETQSSQISPKMFDHALKLVDPNSASGKELLKAKRAQRVGDSYAVRKALYKAFDKLPASEKKYVLGVDQKRTIEDQISQLLQTAPKINSSKLKKVDELASKSYDHLQKGGSLTSYRYLLEALDLAESPLSKELVQRLLSKSKKNQIGGAAPLPVIIGASSLGVLVIIFIIYTLFRRQQTDSPSAQPPTPTTAQAEPRGFVSGGVYDVIPDMTPAQMLAYAESQGFGFIPSPNARPANRPPTPYGVMPSRKVQIPVYVTATGNYGQYPQGL